MAREFVQSGVVVSKHRSSEISLLGCGTDAMYRYLDITAADVTGSELSKKFLYLIPKPPRCDALSAWAGSITRGINMSQYTTATRS